MHNNKEYEKTKQKEGFGSANREYKDRLFKFIFGNPENNKWTLSLYNAMNGTHYDNPDNIIINTIKDVQELMDACKPLSEYAWIVEEIHKNSKAENVTTKQAVDAALDSMPDDFLIKPFLITNKTEVILMCITEYDEEKTFAAMRREEREKGAIDIALKLLARGKDSFDEISELTGLNLDKIEELAVDNISFGF